jgi:hypothetical protein
MIILAAGLAFIFCQFALAVVLGARRDRVSPFTPEFWRS